MFKTGPLQLRLQMQKFLEEHFYLLFILEYYNYSMRAQLANAFFAEKMRISR